MRDGRHRFRRSSCALAVLGLILPWLSLMSAKASAADPPPKPDPVLAWGDNSAGEAGNGGSGDQHYIIDNYDAYNDYPVAAGTLTGAIAISTKGGSSAAIVAGKAADGTPDSALNTVWTWGDDQLGQLGTRPPGVCNEPVSPPDWIFHMACATSPVEVRGPGGIGYLTGIVAIATGDYHMLALRYDGTLWAWGDDSYDELGVAPPSTPNAACPTSINEIGGVDIDRWCEPYPVRVPGLTDVTSIAAGLRFSLAIVHHGGPAPDDTVWAWGDNSVGELGQGTDGNPDGPDGGFITCGSSTPVEVPGIQGAAAVSAGEAGQVMVITRGQATDGSDNELWSWGGANDFGELGDNLGAFVWDASHKYLLTVDQPTRVLDPSGTGFFTGAVAVSTDVYSTVALKYDSGVKTTMVWNWGLGTPAASGTPGGIPGAPSSPYYWTTPRQIRGAGGNGFLTGGIAVAATIGSVHVLLADGTVWGWGDNLWGELAQSWLSQPDNPFPIQARGVAGATAVAAGGNSLLAIGPLPPPAPPPVVHPENNTPPPLPYEQTPIITSYLQPQPPSSVPVVNPGVVPSTASPPQGPLPGGSVTSQLVSTPVHVATPAHAPPAMQGQLGAGGALLPGSPGAIAPSAGDRPTPTDQLAMLRHDDASDVAWAIGIAGAAAAGFAVCVVAASRSRRPPAVRAAAAWAPGAAPRSPRNDASPPCRASLAGPRIN